MHRQNKPQPKDDVQKAHHLYTESELKMNIFLILYS